MGIKTKLLKIGLVFRSEILVFQPGRVGSTAIYQAIRSELSTIAITHFHSFYIDSIYCYKRTIIHDYISTFVSRLFILILCVVILLRGRKVTVVIPFRDVHKRNQSVFIEYFEEISFLAKSKSWYRSFYKRSTKDFVLKCYSELLRTDGQEVWFNNEAKWFLERKHRNRFLSEGSFENRFFKVVFVDIDRNSSFRIENIEFKLASKSLNTGATKWCAFVKEYTHD